jgi:hypothetical protein
VGKDLDRSAKRRDMHYAVGGGAALWTDVAVIRVLGCCLFMLLMARWPRLRDGVVACSQRMAEVQHLRSDCENQNEDAG